MSLMSLEIGPIVGHADTSHVRLWGRGRFEKTASGSPRRCFGVARIRKQGSRSYSAPRYFKMSPNFDLTGVAIFSGLEADSGYNYQMGCFFSDKELPELKASMKIDWSNASSGQFTTASDDPEKPLEFIFGSCRYLLRLFGGSWFDDRGDKTFRSIIRQLEKGFSIDKFLMVGDQIYADDLNFLSPDEQVDDFLGRYRDAFSQHYLRQLMSRVPTYMTLDDHEIEDNWPAKASERDMMVKYPAAMHAYQVYQLSHSPLLKVRKDRLTGTPDNFYYEFADGCGEFFVMDSRTEREPGEGPAAGEMVGERQLQDLLAWLGNGSGRVKFVVTSVPFFPDLKKANEDKWSGFRRQRDKIISCIREKRVEKVVFLSGDVHCSMASELDISASGEDPLFIYSIISSAFYWPYPHEKRRQFQLTGYVASASNERAYELGQSSDVFSGDNFTRISVSKEWVVIDVFERKGEHVYHMEYVF